MLLQLHLYSRLNTWLQWIGQRQLQGEIRNIYVLGSGATYIRDLTVILQHAQDESGDLSLTVWPHYESLWSWQTVCRGRPATKGSGLISAPAFTNNGYVIAFNICYRDHFVCALSQWETTLHCNVVSHWLGAYTKWSLILYHVITYLCPNFNSGLAKPPLKLGHGWVTSLCGVIAYPCPRGVPVVWMPCQLSKMIHTSGRRLPSAPSRL